MGTPPVAFDGPRSVDRGRSSRMIDCAVYCLALLFADLPPSPHLADYRPSCTLVLQTGPGATTEYTVPLVGKGRVSDVLRAAPLTVDPRTQQVALMRAAPGDGPEALPVDWLSVREDE